MSRIRSKDTSPELAVRKVLFGMGYRYRLHSSKLPGKPDIVLSKYKSVVFVHGCFWHRHPGCRFAYTPKSRLEFWNGKFEANVRRDDHAKRQLKDLGWKQLTIWECETRKPDAVARRLKKFLEGA